MTHAHQKRRLFMLVENQKHDYSNLTFFGEVHYILPKSQGALDKFNLDEVHAAIQEALIAQKFDPASDAFVVAGVSPHLLILGSAISSLFPDERLTVLVWDSKNSAYVAKSFLSSTVDTETETE